MGPAFKIHELKIWPVSFGHIIDCRKISEFRYDDRGFNVGDWLLLREWDPVDEEYVGGVALVEVSFISRGEFGIPDGYCILEIEVLASREED